MSLGWKIIISVCLVVAISRDSIELQEPTANSTTWIQTELDLEVVSNETSHQAKIFAQQDLTGDGKPEVIWVSTNSGAHTTFYSYTVSTWLGSKLTTIPGEAVIASQTKAEIRDGKLLLSGGLIDSVGAGPWQSEFIETYSVEEQVLKRTTRDYAQSLTPYHHLISGLWAESLGYKEKALREYTEAAEMRATSYKEYAFIFDGEWVEGGRDNDREAEFERIVKQFAELRKARLTEVSQGMDAVNACDSAKKKTGYDATWLPYLNAPAGYANPRWEERSICSDINNSYNSD